MNLPQLANISSPPVTIHVNFSRSLATTSVESNRLHPYTIESIEHDFNGILLLWKVEGLDFNLIVESLVWETTETVT